MQAEEGGGTIFLTGQGDHVFSAYGLAQKGAVGTRLVQLPPDELAQFLAIYKRQAQQRWLARHALAGDTDIFPDSRDTDMGLEVVKQLAIYANRVYLHDRLFELACGWPHRAYNPSSWLQSLSPQKQDHQALLKVAEVIEEMLALRPLVEAKIVHFTPTSLLHQHRNPRAIYIDQFYGSGGSGETLVQTQTPLELPPAFQTYL